MGSRAVTRVGDASATRICCRERVSFRPSRTRVDRITLAHLVRRPMPERIDLPRDSGVGSGAELREDASVPELQVKDHVRVRRRRLVRHDPAAAGKFELAGGDEAANDGLRRGVEAPPVALEEALLDVCKEDLARTRDVPAAIGAMRTAHRGEKRYLPGKPRSSLPGNAPIPRLTRRPATLCNAAPRRGLQLRVCAAHAQMNLRLGSLTSSLTTLSRMYLTPAC